jgi:hypothetical protein
MREEFEAITPPNASPTDDDGILMSWTCNGRHLEIEMMSDGTYEWFYRHRASNTAEGGENNDETLAEPLLAHIREVMG